MPSGVYPRKKIQRHCFQCGKLIEGKRSQREGKKYFCGVDCRIASQVTPVNAILPQVRLCLGPCNVEKSIGEFSVLGHTKNGIPYYGWCKPCLTQRIKDQRLLRLFNLTVADYERLLTYQGGVCAICKRPPKEEKRLAVDHDHKTGLIRGLLCHVCNQIVGYFQDNAQSGLENAIVYLQIIPATLALGVPRYGKIGPL